jgi:hypothetical protein
VAGTSSKLGENYSTVAGAYGVGPDTLILHPRRLAFLQSQTIANGENQPNRMFSLYDRIIEAPATPTTLNTNQDALLSIRSEAVHLFAESEITTHTDPGSLTPDEPIDPRCWDLGHVDPELRGQFGTRWPEHRRCNRATITNLKRQLEEAAEGAVGRTSREW